jgi:hypothetical protein
MSSEAKDNPFHQQILDDDTAFVTAVHMYKNIVTHYLASKFEIWMNLFMKPIYGFKGGNCSKEFAQSRGAIHYHVAGQSDHLWSLKTPRNTSGCVLRPLQMRWKQLTSSLKSTTTLSCMKEFENCLRRRRSRDAGDSL